MITTARGTTVRRSLSHSALITVLLATLLSFVSSAAAPGRVLAAPSTGSVAAQCAVLTEQEAALAAQVDALNAQVDSLSAQIAAHNVQVIDNTNAAAVAAYNATADALNAQKDGLNAQVQDLNQQVTALAGRESACQVSATAVSSALEGSQPGDWSYTPTQSVVDTLTQRLAGVNRNVPPLTPNARGQFRVTAEMRPIYDPVRASTPPRDVRPGQLQGQAPPAVGDPDPAYPGAVIQAASNGQPAIAVDHIVPLAEILSLPGFTQLDPVNMLLVANAPVNFQYLSREANSAKGSGPLSRIVGADPDWVAGQQQLHDDVLTTLQQAITDLLAVQQTIAG